MDAIIFLLADIPDYKYETSEMVRLLTEVNELSNSIPKNTIQIEEHERTFFIDCIIKNCSNVTSLKDKLVVCKILANLYTTEPEYKNELLTQIIFLSSQLIC